jgi:phosphatidylinositol alpha 1,6-mannosyltransferase
VRVAIVAECFLPETNGVTNSVLRVVEHLERRNCQALVVAPGPGPTRYSRTQVERVAAIQLPFYKSLAIGLPTGRLVRVLREFRPDVVHLAAPAILGAAGARAARRLGVPAVAVYQTDLAGFATRYRLGLASGPIWKWLRWVHNQAALTLAPSSLAAWTIQSQGVERVARWGRGVDVERFHPKHRSPLLRRRLAPAGEILVGFVGRLAPEKQVHLLTHLQGIPGVRLVVVGDGPSAVKLRQQLPKATFVGFKSGAELASHVASLDVFVHTGADETFCQAIQEALAAGVPVVTPAAGGPLDLVRHGDNGLLFPPGQPALMRQAVLELVRNAELRARMARNARRSVQGRTWVALGDELMDHYASVADLPQWSRAA